MNKTFTRILSIGVILSTLLTGCSVGTDKENVENVAGDTAATTEEASGEKVVLSYYTWSDMKVPDQAVVDAFNEIDPNLQVELKSIANDTYDSKLQVLLSGGSEVDIFAIRTQGQSIQYAQNGALADITENLNGSSIDLAKYGPLIDNVVVENTYYALPRKSEGWSLFYNKDIFDAEGMPYPEQMTWDEYGELAKTLTKGAANDKQWGGYFSAWLLNLMALQNGEYLIDDSLEHTKEALMTYNRFYNEDLSHMSAADMIATASNYLPEFESGNIAMLPQGDWTIAMLLNDEKAGKSDINWDIAPMPVPEGVEPGTTVGGFSTVAISANAKNKDAAFKFLEFMCGEQGAIVSAQNAVVGAYNVDLAAEEYVKATGKESTKIVFEEKVIQEEVPHPKYNRVKEVFNQNANLYLLGEKTIDETMALFLKDREAVLAE